MTEATWARCAKEFSWDGSWRDIYIHGTSIADWNALVQALPGWGYRVEFLADNHPQDLPAVTKRIFDEWAEAPPLLRIHVGPVLVQCHFFTEAEMEFDHAKSEGPANSIESSLSCRSSLFSSISK